MVFYKISLLFVLLLTGILLTACSSEIQHRSIGAVDASHGLSSAVESCNKLCHDNNHKDYWRSCEAGDTANVDCAAGAKECICSCGVCSG